MYSMWLSGSLNALEAPKSGGTSLGPGSVSLSEKSQCCNGPYLVELSFLVMHTYSGVCGVACMCRRECFSVVEAFMCTVYILLLQCYVV